MIDLPLKRRRKRQRFRLLLPALLAVAFASPVPAAFAQSSYETLLSLMGEGRYDEARGFAARIAGSETVKRNNLAFLEALIHKRERRFAEAARRLSDLLDADPAQGRVRQELAHSLFLMRDDDRARYHFEFLKSTVESARLHAVYDRFLVAIRNRRPWTLGGFVGFAPSTNINDGTSSETVHIAGIPFTNANAAKSGVGLSYGFSGSYRFDLGPQWALTLGGSLSGASYTESRFDRLTLRGTSELSRDIGGWHVGAGLAGERNLSGWRGYGTGYGPYVTARRHMGTKGTLDARLSWMQRRYDTVSAYDGWEADILLGYRHIFSPRLAASLSVSAGRVHTTSGFTSYDSVQPGVSADYLVNANLILHASASYEHRAYQGQFPLTGTPRRDERYTLGVGATLRGLSFQGFVPRINYEYHHTASNVELFERSRHGVGLMITKRY
ncbi:porin family protein [Nitratireductor soli]|uniref:porin family protein n=1 Tax=Nitratireductor soli TaxID=1670619 RepID=UPI00065E3645|nr:porin family protein [Nitratireductor soli]